MADDERGFSPGTVILAFLSGALLGAAGALLLAPQSGRETVSSCVAMPGRQKKTCATWPARPARPTKRR